MSHIEKTEDVTVRVQSVAQPREFTPEEWRQLAFMASRYITTIEEQKLVERCWKFADRSKP